MLIVLWNSILKLNLHFSQVMGLMKSAHRPTECETQKHGQRKIRYPNVHLVCVCLALKLCLPFFG